MFACPAFAWFECVAVDAPNVGFFRLSRRINITTLTIDFMIFICCSLYRLQQVPHTYVRRQTTTATNCTLMRQKTLFNQSCCLHKRYQLRFTMRDVKGYLCLAFKPLFPFFFSARSPSSRTSNKHRKRCMHSILIRFSLKAFFP